MANEKDMTRLSATEMKVRRDRGDSRTDLARVKAKTEEELAADIATDPDWSDVPVNWQEAAQVVMPTPKQLITLRLDAEVVDWFRHSGPGYQTRINAALLAYKRQVEKATR